MHEAFRSVKEQVTFTLCNNVNVFYFFHSHNIFHIIGHT